MQSGAVAVADAEVFESLTKAVRARGVVEIQYKKLAPRRFAKREMEPLHVGYVDGQWYLFAWDLKREGERTFALSRVRSVQVTRRKVAAQRVFSIGERLRGSFAVFSSEKGGRRHRVGIRFDAFVAQLVRERQWHESQVVQELAGGGLELEMRLGSLHEVERWVLSWGEHAEVLAPKKLRARVLEVARGIVVDSTVLADLLFVQPALVGILLIIFAAAAVITILSDRIWRVCRENGRSSG